MFMKLSRLTREERSTAYKERAKERNRPSKGERTFIRRTKAANNKKQSKEAMRNQASDLSQRSEEKYREERRINFLRSILLDTYNLSEAELRAELNTRMKTQNEEEALVSLMTEKALTP
jgi:hypothetical protein